MLLFFKAKEALPGIQECFKRQQSKVSLQSYGLHTVLSDLEVVCSFSHFVICLLILHGVLDTQTFFTAVFLLEFRQAFTFLENRNVTAEIISMLLG